MLQTKICKKYGLRFQFFNPFIHIFNLTVRRFRIIGAFVVIGTAARASATNHRHYKGGKAKHSQEFTDHIIPH